MGVPSTDTHIATLKHLIATLLTAKMDPSGGKADSMDEVDDTLLLQVETAIPLFRCASDDSRPSVLPRGEAFEEDDDEDDEDDDDYYFEDEDLEYGETMTAEDELIDEKDVEWTIKRDGTLMGLIIGCFIQFASLGARFMLTAVYAQNQDVAITRKTLVELSFGWSFLTSSMGVGILFIVGNVMANGSFYASNLVQGWRSTLELSFAIGALTSVCLAWSATDLVLGVPGHATESVLIWLSAIVWAKFGSMVSQYWSNRSEEEVNQELKESLLHTQKEEAKAGSRLVHVMNGLLVGCFIQFSSLGANFLLQAKLSDGVKTNGQLSRQVIVFSFIWSVVTSAMGVLILVLKRNILNVVSVQTNNMECSYSLGAILGVNLSWIVTDFILGYSSLPSWWHWSLVVGSLLCGAFL